MFYDGRWCGIHGAQTRKGNLDRLLELCASLVEHRKLSIVRVDTIALQDNVVLALGQRAVEFVDGDDGFVRTHVMVPLLSRLM
jgi:hypothetical protein